QFAADAIDRRPAVAGDAVRRRGLLRSETVVLGAAAAAAPRVRPRAPGVSARPVPALRPGALRGPAGARLEGVRQERRPARLPEGAAAGSGSRGTGERRQ